ALLIFLVCAVVSSVVVVAATAAAGRMSQLPEMDQRYYAVTSAAGLLRSEIEGKKLVVKKTTTKAESGDVTTTYSVKYDTDEDYRTPGNETILTDASIALVQILKNEIPSLSKTLTLTVARYATDTNLANVDLGCSIAESMGKDGLLRFNVSDSSGKYTLCITFSPNIKESVPDADGAIQTTLTWKFHSMRKIRGTVPAGEAAAS
ncbi:MAG: hypothetical protein IJ646_10565, partial [Clostridia bacterium]|nr:hypothetical protein [Clostridia bacterium]